MKWYEVTKKIGGRLYLYRQRTYREGGRIRTQSQYVGAVSDVGKSSISEASGSNGNSFIDAEPNLTLQKDRSIDNRMSDAFIAPLRKSRDAKKQAALPQRDDKVIIAAEEFDVDNWTPTNPFVNGATPRPIVILNKGNDNSTRKRSFSMTALEAEYSRAAYQLTRLGLDGSKLASIKLIEGKKPGWLRIRPKLGSRTSGQSEYKVFLSPGKRGSSGRNLFKANYRIALAHSILDGIEAQRPAVFERLRSVVDHSWINSKLLVIGHILSSEQSNRKNDPSRLFMIAQFLWFNHLPPTLAPRFQRKHRKTKTLYKGGLNNLELMSNVRPVRWQDEAAKVMADVMQRGFKASSAKYKKDVARSKTNARRCFKQYQKLTPLQRLSTKGRKKWKNYKRHETSYLLARQQQSRFEMLAPFLSNFHDKTAMNR